MNPSQNTAASRASLLDQENQKSHTLDGRKLIGRSFDADIKIVDLKVSKQHAEIFMQENQYYIRDFSVNGTKINGVKIPKEQPVPINNQDKLDIEGHKFIFKMKDISKTKAEQSPSLKSSSKKTPLSLAHDDTTDNYEDYSQYETAGFVPRLCANIVDSFILGFINVIGQGVLGFLIKKEFVILGLIIGFLGIFLVPFLYYYLQLKKDGQTVGKKLFKLKVIHLIDQDQLTATTIITREFVGKLVLSLFSPIMLILYLRNAEKRAFHDHLASTRVLKLTGGK